MPEVKLTRRGRRAHLDGLSPQTILIMEILRRITANDPIADLDNVADMVDELVQRYGSFENAILAMKCGKVGFEKIE